MALIHGIINFLVAVDIIFVIFFLVTVRPTFKQSIVWTVIIMAIPVLGFAICFNYGPVNYRKCFLSEKDIMGDDAERYAERTVRDIESENHPGNEDNYALIKRISQYSDISFSVNNDIETYERCEDYYDHLQRDMECAKEYIHIEVYIMEGDSLTQRFMDILYRKLDEGVKVRFLCDDIGLSANAHQMILDLIEKGGEFATFNPLINQVFSAKKANRLHKKVIVVDGRCSYTGGINFSNEYLGLSVHGKWRDFGLRLTGDVVHQMNVWFAIDWNYASKKVIPKEHLARKESDPVGDLHVQHVSAGMYPRNQISEDHIEHLLRSAKKSIHIETPYLIPTGRIYKALIEAARSGVDVIVLMSEYTDHNMVGYNNELSAYRLVKRGVKVNEYVGAFLHTKRIIIDGKVCALGSINFDRLSLKHAFETNVLVYSEELSARMEEVFSSDIGSSKVYTRESYKGCGFLHKVKRFLSLVFRPFV